MMNKIFIFFACVFGFVLGFFVKDLLFRYKILNYKNTYCYEYAWQDAKRYINNRLGGTMVNNIHTKFINGKIKKIVNNKIIIESRSRDLLPAKRMLLRDVIIDDNTTIDILTKKDEAIYQKELSEFKNKNEQNKWADIPELYPSKYFYKKINFNQLKIDQEVFVRANEYIDDKKSFTASKITVMK